MILFLLSLSLCLFYSDYEVLRARLSHTAQSLSEEGSDLECKYYLDGNAVPTMFMTLIEKYALLSVENLDLNENVELFVWKRRTLSMVSIFPRKISEGSLQNPEILVKSKAFNNQRYKVKQKTISSVPWVDFLPPCNSLETLFCHPDLVRALIP